MEKYAYPILQNSALATFIYEFHIDANDLDQGDPIPEPLEENPYSPDNDVATICFDHVWNIVWDTDFTPPWFSDFFCRCPNTTRWLHVVQVFT